MLKQRIITALILLAGLSLALIYVPANAMWIVFAGMVALAGWEWGGLLGLGSNQRYAMGAAVIALCVLVKSMSIDVRPYLVYVSVLFWLGLIPLWLRSQWRVGGGFVGVFIGLLLLLSIWGAFDVLYQQGPWRLLAVMALVWVADVAAYFTGRAFGKHKLAPSISPGKTWEGVAGAVVGVQLYGLLLLPAVSGWQWPLSVLAAALALLILTAVSVMGDLFESMLKRQAGIKDSSALLPGHGGVLDRIDSLIATVPLAALLTEWM
jgi:phosphatidate cytidylyltransferase